MDRHFLIPVTIAAVVHGLLLAVPRGPVHRATRPPAAVDDRVVPAIPLTPMPPEAEVDVASSAAGAPDPVPRSPEPLPTHADAPFMVPVTYQTPRADLGPIDRIPADAIGVPGGTGREFGSIILSSALDRPPQTRTQISPTYPPLARNEGRTGDVLVEFVVDESGRVMSPHVVKSTDPIFDDAAVRAVERWRFMPGTVQNRPVRFRMAVPIVFRLNEE